MPVLFAAGAFAKFVFGTFFLLSSLFLILLVLVQRGKGGGLTGALGGMGGQSAFGAKAGDVFTRITLITAGVWIVMAWAGAKVFQASANASLLKGSPPATAGTPASNLSGASIPGKGASNAEDGATREGAAEIGTAGGAAATLDEKADDEKRDDKTPEAKAPEGETKGADASGTPAAPSGDTSGDTPAAPKSTDTPAGEAPEASSESK